MPLWHTCIVVFSDEPLVLDRDDPSEYHTPPMAFNIIDTSNLVDHCGAINVIVAASPLLKESVSATLYTESLVKEDENHKALLNELLCGDFPPTVLGLFPIEHWTNATAISTAEETIFDTLSELSNKTGGSRQMRNRITWKRTLATSEPLSEPLVLHTMFFVSHELAHILYHVYESMFQHEDIFQLMSNQNFATMKRVALPPYHRGSFVALLRLIRSRATVDWEYMMDKLCHLITQDNTTFMGSTYIQELYLQLHVLGVYTVTSLQQSFDTIDYNSTLNDLRSWKSIPEMVSVTIQVPRSALQALTTLPPLEAGSAILHSTLHSHNGS